MGSLLFPHTAPPGSPHLTPNNDKVGLIRGEPRTGSIGLKISDHGLRILVQGLKLRAQDVEDDASAYGEYA